MMWLPNGKFAKATAAFSESKWGRNTKRYGKSVGGLSPRAWEEIIAGAQVATPMTRKAAPGTAATNVGDDSDSDSPRTQLLSDPVDPDIETL